MKNTYLFLAEAFGYGPIVTACNLAKKIKHKKKCRLIFAGPIFCVNVAKKFRVFDEIIICNSYNEENIEKNIRIFKEATGIIATETTDILIYLINKYEMNNLYLVDNLFWMWDSLEDELKQLRRYYISNTIDCTDNINRIGNGFSNLKIVGPTREMNKFNRCEAKKNLMISFGGAESCLLLKEKVNKFYLKLLNVILETPLLKKFKKIYITGGEDLITFLSYNVEQKNIHFESMNNKKYIKKLKNCSHAILSPGLGNFNEISSTNIKVLFLLPINYSQYLQRERYKKLNLDFYFQEFNEVFVIDNYLEETKGVKEVIKHVEKYIKENNFNDFKKCLYNFLGDQDFNTIKRREYYELLLKDSLEKISEDIIKDRS